MKSLERLNNPVFTINDIAKIIKKSKKYASLLIYRLRKNGLVVEIEKNKYTSREINIYELSSNLIFPSYISFLTAFSYYNLTTQIPKQIQIISLKAKKEIKFDNYIIKFIKFKPNRFFGYKRKKTPHGFIFIAELEKAIVDSLYMPRYCPVDEIYGVLCEAKIDIQKLISYSLKIKSKVVLKRLGYLLEKRNIDLYNKFKEKINKKYDYLDIISKKGKKNNKWKLIINRAL